jgi:hypothetical protein
MYLLFVCSKMLSMITYNFVVLSNDAKLLKGT